MSQIDREQLLLQTSDCLWSVENRLKGIAATFEHITEDSCFSPNELLGLGLVIKGLAQEISKSNEALQVDLCKRANEGRCGKNQ